MFAFYEKKGYKFLFYQGHSLEISAHFHGHIELVFMIEGKSDTFVDGVKDILCAGDIFVTFPNQIHQYQKIDYEKYLVFIFSPEELPEISDTFLNYVPSTPIIKNAVNNQKLLPLLQAAFEAFNTTSPYREIIIKGNLLAFFGELYPMMTLLPVKTTGISVLKTILNYCTENYKNDLSLDILSNDLHISKCYISHLFNDKLHMGFNEYVNGLRISEACRYLLTQTYNVTEIALLVGFNTPRTFNRAFYRQMGMTPRNYKSNKRNDL